MRILLVEDEALIALEQRLYLETAGHEVIGPAMTPAEALAMAEASPPDLALVDVHLARGTNGIDAARALSTRGIPCLYVTSFQDEVREGGRDAGLGCLPKPFSETALLDAIEAARAILAGSKPDGAPQTMELYV